MPQRAKLTPKPSPSNPPRSDATGVCVYRRGWNACHRLSVLGFEHKPRIQRSGRVGTRGCGLHDILLASRQLHELVVSPRKGVSSARRQVYLNEFVFSLQLSPPTPMAASRHYLVWEAIRMRLSKSRSTLVGATAPEYGLFDILRAPGTSGDDRISMTHGYWNRGSSQK